MPKQGQFSTVMLSANMVKMSMESTKDVHEATREKQIKLLSALAKRLADGDEVLPADLMVQLGDELTTRIAQEAITKAWNAQAGAPTLPWRGEAARTARRNRGRDVAEIQILSAALQTLEKLETTAREEIALEIDALAFDPSPRGATGLFHKSDHIQLAVGNHHLLYTVQNNVITVVAITHEPG